MPSVAATATGQPPPGCRSWGGPMTGPTMGGSDAKTHRIIPWFGVVEAVPPHLGRRARGGVVVYDSGPGGRESLRERAHRGAVRLRLAAPRHPSWSLRAARPHCA